MTCKELQDLLLEHRAGELPTRVRLSLVFHASFCACCKALVKTYGLTADLAAELAGAPVPEDVARDVEALLRDIEAGRVEGA